MSFGYSLGDFIAGANLSYRLIRALSETQGACIEYQEAIVELASLQQTFLQVGQMQPNKTLSRATINAAAHIVLSSMTLIGDFLAKTQKYRERLSNAGSGSAMSDSWQKMGWVLFKKEELKALRDALHSRLLHIGVLLSTAQFHGVMPDHVAQFEVKDSEVPSTTPTPSPPPSYTTHMQQSEPNNVPVIAVEYIPLQESSPEKPITAIEIGETVDQSKDIPAAPLPQATLAQYLVVPPSGADVTVSKYQEEDIIVLPEGQADSTEKSRPEPKTERKTSLQHQGVISNGIKLLSQLETFLQQTGNLENDHKEPIKFKDAVGRKFSLPYHLCATWAGIEDLIRQAFLHVEVIGPHVAEGHYDLMGPNGEIILPQVWETMIQPGWSITMAMWPMPERPKPPQPIRLPGPPPGHHRPTDLPRSRGSTRSPSPPPGMWTGRAPPPPPTWPPMPMIHPYEEKSKVRGWMRKAGGLFKKRKGDYDIDDVDSSCSNSIIDD